MLLMFSLQTEWMPLLVRHSGSAVADLPSSVSVPLRP